MAALEFALIAPMLITLYLGLTELSIGISVDRKVSHSVSVAADLATQSPELNATNVPELFHAAVKVAQVTDPDKLTLHLESFTRNDEGDPVSLGSIWFNQSNLDKLDPVNVNEIDGTLLSQEAGLIIARIAYDYQPLGHRTLEHKRGGSAQNGNRFLSQTVKLSEVIMFTPRQSSTIDIEADDKDGFGCSLSGGSVTCARANDPSGGNLGEAGT